MNERCEPPPELRGGVVMEARTLTLATLKSKGACVEQVALFRKMFGKSVQITEALCVEHASAFSWGWAAENLLRASARATYQATTAPALATAESAMASAWDAYKAARASARATYESAGAPALATYEATTASAWDAYEATTAPALATYQAARAPAWAHAYISDAEGQP